MKQILNLIFDALSRRALEREIRQLDERTLRDVGLELEANRARERRRLALRFGEY
jgi:hypothetical protein